MGFKNDSTHWGAKIIQVSLTFALFPLFFIGGPDWADGLFYEAVWNLGHILFFFLITLLLQPQRKLGGWRLVTVTTVVVLVSGGLIELVQSEIGREVDSHDMLRNLVGAWLALVCLSWSEKKPLAVWLARIGVVILLLWELWLVVAIGHQQWQITRQVPQLYNFATTNAQIFWDGNVQRSTRFADSVGDQFSLEVNIATEKYSGASLNNLASDWSNYQNLALTLFNPEKTPLTLVLRINDRTHERSGNAYEDRFNTRLVIAPGVNRFTVSLADVQQAPATRLMDMTDIRRLIIFASNQATATTVYLLELSLY